MWATERIGSCDKLAFCSELIALCIMINAFAARTCIVEVVVTNESNMVSYFPEAGNLNGSNADVCSDVAGPSSSSLGNLFELSDRSK